MCTGGDNEENSLSPWVTRAKRQLPARSDSPGVTGEDCKAAGILCEQRPMKFQFFLKSLLAVFTVW